MSPHDLTPEQRRERGTELCRRLSLDVASVAPAGLGHWPVAWELVADADVEFMVTLSAWEADPTKAARLRVRDAYRAVVDAWRDAASRFEALQEEGREYRG